MRTHSSLKAWQEAHQVTLAVIELGRVAWKPYASSLFFQLQRASLSAELNIAEGYTFGNTPTFTRHLGIAYGSSVETGELLSLLVEAKLVDPARVDPTRERNRQCQRLILGLLKRRRRFPNSETVNSKP